MGFVRQKVTITETIIFADSVSDIRHPDCSRLAKNPKNDKGVTIFLHDVNVKFCWRCFVSLSKFSYWYKFHVNTIIGSGIMSILSYKGLTRNLEIGNTSVWVLPNIWRLGRAMDIKFGTNSSNRMLLSAAKCQCYSFYRFWVIKGKPTGGGVKLLLPPTQIRVKWKKWIVIIVYYIKNEWKKLLSKEKQQCYPK